MHSHITLVSFGFRKGTNYFKRISFILIATLKRLIIAPLIESDSDFSCDSNGISSGSIRTSSGNQILISR